MDSGKFRRIIAAIFIVAFIFTPVLQAQAQFGGPTVVVGDIPKRIGDTLERIAETALTRYANRYLEELIAKIEDSFKIANFLYYTDALVSGQYLQDYLDKYVTEAMDQRMVLAFVPQINCGQNIDISGELQSKAREYLGYNPQELRPDDPDFYRKLSRLGDFYSSPAGWELHYEDLAKKASAEAKAAAQAEVVSPGVKTGRKPGTSQTDSAPSISATVNSILSNQKAAIESALKIGADNAGEIGAAIAQNMIYKYIEEFAFKGSVFAEQSVCISSPSLNPIIPIADRPQENPQEATFIYVDPEFVTPTLDLFLAAKVSLSWDATSLKSKGASKVKINGKGWYSLSGSAEQNISFLDTSYGNFNCYKFLLEVFDSKDQLVLPEQPMVAYVFNSAGSGPSENNAFCGGAGGAQQPRN
jgi:hypothetical protein